MSNKTQRQERCGFHNAHDLVTERPMGQQCERPATKEIEWTDGRTSVGCDLHGLTAIDVGARTQIKAIRPLGAIHREVASDLLRRTLDWLGAGNVCFFCSYNDDEARHATECPLRALPLCAHCGAPEIVCFGAYESESPCYACDNCCGHGNEDGQCELIASVEGPESTT